MSRRINRKNKKLILVFIEYGLHFWLLIFICNVAIFYAFRFFIMASTDKPADTTTIISETPAVSETVSVTPTKIPLPTIQQRPPTPTTSPTPAGPVIGLSFSMPGVGTNGGNLTPLHPKRNIYVYVYKPDADSADSNVRPVNTVRTDAYYDPDPKSPTYTSFVDPYIDLGHIPDDIDSFQITFKAPQALMQLIRDPASSLPGGKVFRKTKGNFIFLPNQILTAGDIFPTGLSNNIMDINDYNMLVNCFSSKASTNKCLSSSTADLDDNGVVDGTDYNLMLLSFRILLEKGFPIPTIGVQNNIVINPTRIPDPTREIKPTSTPTISPSPSPAPVKSSSKGGSGGIFVFIFMLIITGGGIFGAYKLHLLDKFFKKKNPSEAVNGIEGQTVSAGTEGSAALQEAANLVSEAVGTAQEKNAANDSTVSNDKPVLQPSAEVKEQPVNVADKPAAESTTIFSKNDDKPSQSDVIEKTGYLKKGNVDDAAGGIWLTVADDTGITRGFYKGKNVEDGFAKIKGTMKTDAENKTYIQITEITPEG